MNSKLGWRQLDCFIKGNEKIKREKEREDRSSSVSGRSYRGRVLVLCDSVPVGEWEPFLTGHLNLQISLPPF